MDRLHSSPEFLRRVEAAERLGISLAEFDGAEQVEVTEHEYDEKDRLVRSVTRRESLWDEEQQTYMLALARHRDLSCKGCGGWLPETTEKESDGAYVAEAPVRCHRCAAFSIATRQAQNMTNPESLLLQVERREVCRGADSEGTS